MGLGKSPELFVAALSAVVIVRAGPSTWLAGAALISPFVIIIEIIIEQLLVERAWLTRLRLPFWVFSRTISPASAGRRLLAGVLRGGL